MAKLSVHPHTRGEYERIRNVSLCSLGSPPHPWGIRATLSDLSSGSTVHPHTRGEYGSSNPSIRNCYGSPPHPWGIRPLTIGTTFTCWFTPTPVGNTQQQSPLKYPYPVHPHTRGEYWWCKFNLFWNNYGSPPHPWGILILAHWLTERLSVHPHTRGEYVYSNFARTITNGSPPHPWGIRKPMISTSASGRFTPTPVGNTDDSPLTHASSTGSPPHPWGIRRQVPPRPAVSRFTPTPVGNTPVRK